MESQCDAAGWEILLKILRKAPRKKAKAHRASLGETQNKTYPCVSKAPQGRVSVQWLSVSQIYPWWSVESLLFTYSFVLSF